MAAQPSPNGAYFKNWIGLMLLGVFLLPMSSAVASQSAGSHTTGVQRFLVLSTHSSDCTPTVLGFGPIHAKGIDRAKDAVGE